MAATAGVPDRRELLEASRTRSGSLKFEDIENLPPEEVTNIDCEDGKHSRYRSNVTKMKEKFQASISGQSGGEKMSTKPEIKLTKPLSAPSAGNTRVRESKPVPDLDKSPETKRKKISDVKSPTLKTPDVSPTDNLLEATNHVQRFNYTRNMFARMEQENKLAQERERNIRIRRASPNRYGHSHTPPALSPVNTSPSSPERYAPMSPDRHKPMSPEPRKSFDLDSGRTSSSTSDLNSKVLYMDHNISKQSLCGSLEMLKGDSHREPRDSDRISSSSSYASSSSSHSNKPDVTDSIVSSSAAQSYHRPPPSYSSSVRPGSTWLKRLESKENANIPENEASSQLNGDRKERSSSDPEKTGVSSWTRPSRSKYRSKPDSNITDYSVRSAYGSGTSKQDTDRSLSNSHSSAPEQNDNDTSEVTMRGKKGDVGLKTGHRLSKEEIQKAIDKADSYLQKRDDTEPEGKRRSWDIRQKREDFASAKRQSLDLGKKQEGVQEGRVRSSSFNEDSRRDRSSSLNEDSTDGGSGSVPEVVAAHAFVKLSNSGSALNESESDFTSSSLSSSPRPTPIPRRSAPPPPAKPPNVSLNSKHPIIPPPPAPKPGLREDNKDAEQDTITPSASSTVSSSIEQRVVTPDWDPPSKSSDGTKDATEEVEFVSPEEHIYVNQNSEHNILEDADSLLLKREQGDGHEDPDNTVVDHSSEGEGFSENGETEREIVYFEMPGLSSTDEDSSEDEVDYKMASRIKFSRDPIKVYLTYSTDDYDRHNEDVDPVAASAEYELEKRVEKMDVFPVELEKGSEGLGLSIIGMGVGADAGLEKLGIFIKTLTEGGAAQRDTRMQVNDQIIEVDGKSLVGVTQAYAANVLRNTHGIVKFSIGREKDPSKSEVARLIQQSIEQDRRREELRRQERERRLSEDRRRKDEEILRIQEELIPKDEILEHEHKELERHLSQMSESEKGISEDQEKEATSLDMVDGAPAAGDATPLSMPSGMDSDMSSPEEAAEKPTVEVFDLPDSSSDSISPDMESQALFIKLKESQYKNAVADAELAKLRAKIILLENTEAQKKLLDKKCEELTQKVKEGEKSHENTRKQLANYQDLMEGSQGQYIMLEKKMKADFTALEKKYHKAKKLIKDYQQREKDFIQERESLIQQQSEKDQQYNALVKSLKDRIFQLEKDLIETQKAAGLPVDLPKDTTKSELVIEKTEVVKVEATSNGLEDTTSTTSSAKQSRDDLSEISTGSDRSNSDPITTPDIIHDLDKMSPTKSESANEGDLESVPSTPLLDTSAHRAKAHLASSIGTRRPPTKRSKSSESDQDANDTDSLKQEGSESGLETWIKHDSVSTVRKSDAKKRRAFQPIEAIPSPPLSRSAPPISSQVAPPVTESDNNSEQSSRSRRGSHSDNSSSVSQTSYDPSQPQFRHMESEIPDAVSGESHSGEVTLVSAKPSGSKGFGLPKFSLKPKSLGGGSSSSSGIVLLSNRPRDGAATHDQGGITLISKKNIDTGYSDYDGGSSTSEISSSLMVSELDDEGKSSTFNISGTPENKEMVAPNKRSLNQFENAPVLEWTSEHVVRWLIIIEMDKYTQQFQDKNICGPQLLQMDGSRLKSLGVTASKDREILKKKIKDMKLALEKERKQQEKERKAREKEQKKQMKKK